MKQIPILFSAPMVRAIREGRKTQTRRVIKPEVLSPLGRERAENLVQVRMRVGPNEWAAGPTFRLRYRVGNLLWVRETSRWDPEKGWVYRADLQGHDTEQDQEPGRKWRPSIHMPKPASRLTLAVTDVKIERLQRISRADAIAEGVQRLGGGALRWENWTAFEGQKAATPEMAFAGLWDHLSHPGAWSSNPWVCAISFSVHEANIDAIGETS